MITLQTRVSEDLKKQSDALFESMGLTTTAAIKLFLTQCVNQRRLPFTPIAKNPNKETIEALNEENGTTYRNLDELSKLWK